MKTISALSAQAAPRSLSRSRHQGLPPLVSYARHKDQFVLTRSAWVGALPARSDPLVVASRHPRTALVRDLRELASAVESGTLAGLSEPLDAA